MTINVSMRGTPEQASQLQNANSVQKELLDSWHHGTSEEDFVRFTHRPGETIFLTRSSNGGTTRTDFVVTVYVITPLDEGKYELRPAGAGDEGGIAEDDPRKKKDDWWLTVSSCQAKRLMVVSINQAEPLATRKQISADLDQARQDSFVQNLLSLMPSDDADRAQSDRTNT